MHPSPLAPLAKELYAVGFVSAILIRLPYQRLCARQRRLLQRITPTERCLLALMALGLTVVPLVYVASGFPSAANYSTSLWQLIVGCVCFVAGLMLFAWSHRSLGRQWSASLEMFAGHRLIITGPYAIVRHPMYGALLLWALAQALLLPNWIAGPIGLLSTALLCILRIPQEEKMLRDCFPQDYRLYQLVSWRLLPGIW